MSNQPKDNTSPDPEPVQVKGTQGDKEAGFLSETLSVIRKYLKMDMAFVSEFTVDQQVFRHVDSADADSPIKVGGSYPLKDSYCQRVVDGRLPQWIPDAFDVPEARSLQATTALPIRAFIGVPITLQNGDIYGTLCCFSHHPDPSLNERDLNAIRAFAELAARQFEKERAAKEIDAKARAEIETILSGNDLSIVYQPIYDLAQKRIMGFEALSRFTTGSMLTPDLWFAQAARGGLGVELEIRAIARALEGFQALPAGVYVSLNVSPDTVLSGKLDTVLRQAPCERIVLEITEHEVIKEYEKVDSSLRTLRNRGVRIAVDDVGAGYANFRHIINLAPDLIKLDMSLTRGIDSNRAGRAFASAVIRFAQETASTVVAEGVETAGELSALRDIGVANAQGYLLGRPVPLEVAELLCRTGIARGK